MELNLLSTFFIISALINIFFSIYIANKSKLIVVRTMVFLSLTILIITIPHFFINKKFAAAGLRHKIGYENVMNISITDTFNSIFLISIFLLTFSLFSYILLKTKILEKTINSFSSSSRFENLIPKYKGIKSKLKKNKLVSDFSLRLKKNPSTIYIIYFFFLLFYAFTYLNNLGITGVQPYRLPFKLSGIIFYLKIFIIPFFSLILYFFSKRSLSNSLLIIIFSILISLFTLSKTPGFIVILPSLLLNLENKKYYISSILFIAMASIFKLTSILRLNSFYDLNGINQVDTSISLVVNSLNKFLFSDSIIISIWRSIKGIIYRFDSFQNFLLALSYDSSKTYGIKGFLTMLIYKPFVIINDIDLHNMECLGITYSKGLATRGGLLSHYLITFNGGIIYALMFIFLCSVILTTSEVIIVNVLSKYRLNKYSQIILICFTLYYFADAGFDRITVFIMFIFFSLNLLPII